MAGRGTAEEIDLVGRNRVVNVWLGLWGSLAGSTEAGLRDAGAWRDLNEQRQDHSCSTLWGIQTVVPNLEL